MLPRRSSTVIHGGASPVGAATADGCRRPPKGERTITLVHEPTVLAAARRPGTRRSLVGGGALAAAAAPSGRAAAATTTPTSRS